MPSTDFFYEPRVAPASPFHLDWQVIFFMIFAIMGTDAFSQVLPARQNVVDRNGKRQGDWIIYYDKKWTETNDPFRVAFYKLITYKNDTPLILQPIFIETETGNGRALSCTAFALAQQSLHKKYPSPY